MAIQFVNAAKGDTYNNSGDDITTGAFPLTAGNALAVYVILGTGGPDITGSVTLSDTAGNASKFTRVANTAIYLASAGQIVGFYALDCAGHASNVITADINHTGWVGIVAQQFSGVAIANALNVAVRNDTGGTAATTLATPSFSTAQAAEVVVMAHVGFGDQQPIAITAGSGYTIPTNGKTSNYQWGATQYQIFPSVQSNITAAMTQDKSTNIVVAAMSLKGATATGPAKAVFFSHYNRLRRS